MSYPGLLEERYELIEKDHQEFHIDQHIFQKGCNFCIAEKCNACEGTGMTNDCHDICRKCDGRGRVI